MIFESIRNVLVPIHPDGHKFIALFAAVTLLLFVVLPDVFGWIGVLLTAWCVFFFRDPERVTPIGEGLIVAPADGRVSAVEPVVPPRELDLDETERVRVSIFMNVFDTHINRAPAEGRIVKIDYMPGKFVNAELDKASEDNERQAFTVEMADGVRFGVVQIAGLVARRIIRFVETGDRLLAGQRIGLIRFGSRLDVYLPPGCGALAVVGQRTVGGETVIADLRAGAENRYGRRS